MLSIGKIAQGSDAGRYYEEAVAHGREDYYAEQGEAAGRWIGAGADALGLADVIDDGEIGRLLAGQHPEDGELLGRKIADGGVAGFDLTFKAPKSVGILFGIGDDEVAEVLRDCHDQAVADSVAFLERNACRARRGKDGLRSVEGGGFVAAAYGHRTSRAGDPLLHTHVVIGNRIQGPDGRWTAPDARLLYRWAKTAGYLYQARLRHEMTERLGLGWGEVVKGSADLDGFDRKLIEEFSRRRAEILAELERRGERSLLAAQTAALATRKGKDYGVPMGVRADWRARAEAHGMDRQVVEELLAREAPSRAKHEFDVDELTVSSSTFGRRDLLQALAGARPAGATIAEIEEAAAEVLARPDVVRLAVARGEDRFTTVRQLELERALLANVEERRDERVGWARPDLVDDTIARRPLSDEQAELVRAVAGGPGGIQVVRAAAGTGKTFVLDAAREAWARSGVEVIGCSLSARAATELRDQAAIDTTTIAKLTHNLELGRRLPRRGVLVIDEAGMVGTRDLHRLAEEAKRRGTRIVLVGDDRQLPEIDAGGAFRVLAERHDGPGLSEVRRQRHAWDRAALTELRQGDVGAWAAAYSEAGRIVTAPTAVHTRERLADDWWRAHEIDADALMVAVRRADVADLNRRGHERMRDAGRLRGPDVEIAGRSFAVGDRLVLTRNDRKLGVVNGDRGELLGASDGALAVRLDRGGEAQLPIAYAQEGHLEHGYALTAHRAQGATIDEAFVLGTEELYREWAYTAMSRHRESARFYLTAPAPFLNRPALPLDDRQEIADRLVALVGDSRRQQLAVELLDQHPLAARELDALLSQHQEQAGRQRLFDDAVERRRRTPWHRRAERRELDQAIQRAATSDRPPLAEELDELLARPREAGRPRAATDPIPEHVRSRDRSRGLGR